MQSTGDIPCRSLENGVLDIASCSRSKHPYYFLRTAAKGGLACVAGEQGMASRYDGVARATPIGILLRSVV